MRFLAPVTVTTLCSHRVVPPFGANGGSAGQIGINRVIRADGTVQTLRGNDEVDLDIGDLFDLQSPGGGGWGDPS